MTSTFEKWSHKYLDIMVYSFLKKNNIKHNHFTICYFEDFNKIAETH